MHEVLVNRLGGLSLPRKSVVRLTDRPDMTLDVYRGRKTTTTTTCLYAGPAQSGLLRLLGLFLSVSVIRPVLVLLINCNPKGDQFKAEKN